MTVTLDPYVDFRTLPGPHRLVKLLSAFNGTIDGRPFSVPDGFVTDFASVPKVFENIFTNNDPDLLRASIPHDWIYQHLGAPAGSGLILSRFQADAVLREGMAFCGASFMRRWTVWLSVRAGGMGSWTDSGWTSRMRNLRRRLHRSMIPVVMMLSSCATMSARHQIESVHRGNEVEFVSSIEQQKPMIYR